MSFRIPTLLLLVLVSAHHLSAQSHRAEGFQIPHSFVESGEAAAPYHVRGAKKSIFFAPRGVTYAIRGEDRHWAVKMDFVGASTESTLRGDEPLKAIVSYFSADKDQQRAGLRTFGRIRYDALWPGVDLTYVGGLNRIKYAFTVAPGADPSVVRMRYRGATDMRVTETGALRIDTPEGSFEDAAPVAYQEIDGARVDVAMAFRITRVGDAADVTFELGEFDPAYPLVLDPVVFVYSGFIGGTAYDYCSSIDVDTGGNAYVCGYTSSTQAMQFPLKTGPFLTYTGGNWDCFVAKVDPTGTGLVYCGYIGGVLRDRAVSIAVDSRANAIVVGATMSTQSTFPVKNGPGLTFRGGSEDAFIFKVNGSGTGLVYCGYLGSAGADLANDVAVDPAGNAYVAGWTRDPASFVTRTGPDTTANGGRDAFVAKIDPSGTLVYSGFIGGSDDDFGSGIAVDNSGCAYVCGGTMSTQSTFPVRTGPDLQHNGAFDMFVAKVNAAGTGLVHCGYVGGSASDSAQDLVLSPTGDVVVLGATSSDENTFPVLVGPALTYSGGSDGCVFRLKSDFSALTYCGYLGGSAFDGLLCIDLSGERPVIGGNTASNDFPVKDWPSSFQGIRDATLTMVEADGSGLIYSGYLGTAAAESIVGVHMTRGGTAFVCSGAQQAGPGFPILVGPSTVNRGGQDGWVAKIMYVRLDGDATTVSPGGTINWRLKASSSGGFNYQMGSSLGAGPTPIDTRSLGLTADPILLLSVWNVYPLVFKDYRGSFGFYGDATAQTNLPTETALVGLTIYSAFVTLQASAPSGIQAISNTESFQVIP